METLDKMSTEELREVADLGRAAQDILAAREMASLPAPLAEEIASKGIDGIVAYRKRNDCSLTAAKKMIETARIERDLRKLLSR